MKYTNEGIKDGLQEVPKGDQWSRSHLSFTGNLCLHLRDISAPRQFKKGYKTQSPSLTQGPSAFSNMQSISSILYK
jgi:hypothetical protein